jgi:hypothetical protein
MSNTSLVFLIPELLELILSNLTFHDLLRASTICKAWRALILEVSRSHRQVLFLRPHSAAQRKYLARDLIVPKPSDISNVFPTRPIYIPAGLQSLDENFVTLGTIAKINPFLENEICYTAMTGTSKYTIQLRPTRWNLRKLFRLSASTNSAREMFITQPPCTSLSIRQRESSCYHPACRSPKDSSPLQLADDGGITIGMLVDALESLGSGVDARRLLCKHEMFWYGLGADKAEYGMGRKIFEAGWAGQVVVLEGVVHDQSDEVLAARRRLNASEKR